MPSLLDEFASQLQGNTLTQMSQQLGTDEDTTAKAISMALPMLVGGLARNAGTAAGAQSLEQALDEDHDGSLLDNVSALFGGQGAGSMSPKALNGAGILGHILGGQRAPVEQGVGRAAGLNSQQTARLLMMLAPLVMAYLSRRKQAQGAGAGGVAPVLRQEQEDIVRRAPAAGGLLGQIFGAVGQDGGQGAGGQSAGIAGELARMAPGVLGALFGKRA